MNFRSLDICDPRKRNLNIQKRFRKGATTVEFALVLPLLLVFIFGAVEYGRVNSLLHSAESAAYEGCRVGIVVNATKDECVEAAEEILQTVSVDNAIIEVIPETMDGDSVTVSVVFQYEAATPLGFLKKFEVRRSCKLTKEK